MALQADEVPLAPELPNVLRVASRLDASQVLTHLLDLPTDLLLDVLRRAIPCRAIPWRCRLVCRTFRTHIDASCTSVHLTSLTKDASLGSELRALLARLPGLKQLVASDTINDIQLNFLSACPQLVSLRLEHSAWLEDLSRVTLCTGLESLCVQGCYNLRSMRALTPLSSCSRLLSLLCKGIDGVDLAPLAACRKLTSLALPYSRNIIGFATLSAFTNLQRLSLTSSEIPDFASTIEKCTALTWLDVSCLSEAHGSRPTQIDFVTALVHLVHLNLSGQRRLASITPLTSCQNLQSLELIRCEAIAQLPLLPSMSQQLTALRIESCDAAHINVVAGFTQLVQLELDSWVAVRDLAALAACRQLASLHVPFCVGLVDVLPIASCALLTSLSFRHCRMLSNINPVSALPLLQQLNIAATGVADITPVGRCPLMADLDLSWCKCLPHITSLAACGKLQRLDLRGCSRSITDLSVLLRLPSLMSVLVDEDLDTCHLDGRIRCGIGKGWMKSH